MEMVHLWLVLTFQTYTYGFLLVHRFNSVLFVIRTESIETEEEWAHQLQEVCKKVKCQEPSSIRFPARSIQVEGERCAFPTSTRSEVYAWNGCSESPDHELGKSRSTRRLCCSNLSTMQPT